MKNITILSAKPNRQVVEIDGKKYEFEFSEKELADSIGNNCWSLTERSGLNWEHSESDKAEYIACDWEYSDVEQLISDFITENPNNLIDHLVSE